MNKIDRTLIWFETENGGVYELAEHFFDLSLLMNRLLNEFYDGKKIKFLNIWLGTQEKFEKVTVIPVDYTHAYGGDINHYRLIDLEKLLTNLSDRSQSYLYVWELACKALADVAASTKNAELLAAVESAGEKGRVTGIDTDFELLKTESEYFNVLISATIWITFKENMMVAILRVYQNNQPVSEKMLDQAKKGNEYFLTIFKSIIIDGDRIIIKGRKEIKYLPMEVRIDQLIG